MSAKVKKSEWIQGSKTLLGLYMSGPCRGPGWANAGYYHAIWEISEWRQNPDHSEQWRTRIENGPAVRNYSEGYDACVSLYRIFLERAAKAKGES